MLDWYLLPAKERQKFKIGKPFSEERCLRGLQDDLQHDDVALVANGQVGWNWANLAHSVIIWDRAKGITKRNG